MSELQICRHCHTPVESEHDVCCDGREIERLKADLAGQVEAKNQLGRIIEQKQDYINKLEVDLAKTQGRLAGIELQLSDAQHKSLAKVSNNEQLNEDK